MEDVDELLAVVDTARKSRAVTLPKRLNEGIAILSGNLTVLVSMS
jgi:hypothetical protein